MSWKREEEIVSGKQEHCNISFFSPHTLQWCVLITPLDLKPEHGCVWESSISPYGICYIYQTKTAINQHLSEITYRIQPGSTSHVLIPPKTPAMSLGMQYLQPFLPWNNRYPECKNDEWKLPWPLWLRITSHSYSEESNTPPHMWQPCHLHCLHLLAGILSLHLCTPNWCQDTLEHLLYGWEISSCYGC